VQIRGPVSDRFFAICNGSAIQGVMRYLGLGKQARVAVQAI